MHSHSVVARGFEIRPTTRFLGEVRPGQRRRCLGQKIFHPAAKDQRGLRQLLKHFLYFTLEYKRHTENSIETRAQNEKH